MAFQSIFSRKNKPLIFAFAISLVTAVIFTITIIISLQYYQKQKVQQLQSELNLVTENIRKIMTNSNLAAFSVGITIDPSQDTIKNFDYVAKEIIERNPYLFGVQILRGGEIQFVYPYKVHQSVVGFDILKDPKSKIEAQKAIDKKEIYYAGPLEFQQGGKGIIGRLPIFHEKEFWGFSAVLIRMEEFLRETGISKSKTEDISIQLSKINPNTGEEEFFTSNNVDSNLFLNYKIEESGWKITAVYQKEPFIFFLFGVIIILALASSFGSGHYTYQILKRPEKLEALLTEKTKEIEENNQYLTSMVQAIPDLIFIHDKEARYLDFHAYSESLLFYKPKEFIGKSVYQLFDEKFAKDIHNVILKAIESNEIVEHSYHFNFKDGRKYFDSRFKAINSEKVLAVVREVTESKISAQNLEKSEQKYRNLVSQASDMIFLSDEQGNFLELNKKGHQLTGIPPEDVQKYNLNNFIKLENIDGFSIISIIHYRGSALEEASLITLDNKKIAVEISCKITPSRQIQGIIRDITARNNYIRSIQKQNDRLREIAWIQSHEVRAPLARLLGLLDFLDNYGNVSQIDKNKAIQSIRDSALELDNIIRDVVKKTEQTENAKP
ncbi:MAG: PAS domain S-box protein [Bacteroidota bacterium]